MNWVLFALVAALVNALGDFFLKLAAGKVTNCLGVLIYGCCTFLTGLVWTAVQWRQGEQLFVKPAGAAAGLGVGICFGISAIAFYGTFGRGAPVSIASPFIRLGGLLAASALGILILREDLTPRYVIGLALAIAGVYLIVTR